MSDQRTTRFGPPQRRPVQLATRGSIVTTPAKVAVLTSPQPITVAAQPPSKANQSAPAMRRLPVTQNSKVFSDFTTGKPSQHKYSAAHFASLNKKLESAPNPVSNNISQIQKSLIAEQATPKLETTTNKKSRKLQYAFTAAGIVVFVVGIGVSVMSFRTNTQVVAQAEVLGQAQNKEDENAGDNPSEEPLDKNAVTNYKVAPDAPRRLSISKIGVDSRVLSLGVKTNSELKTPTNVYDSGWYNASAKPGEPGAMLIDGHVHGPTKPGVFYGLKKLAKNDVIEVERGDGKLFKYKVVKTQVYDANQTDMNAAMTPIVPGKPGLNLITCAGKLDKKTNLYNERLIVFATLAE